MRSAALRAASWDIFPGLRKANRLADALRLPGPCFDNMFHVADYGRVKRTILGGRGDDVYAFKK